MTDINLGKKEVIHFIGIGGIGMSGLAQIMKNMGFNVQGSDLYKNKNTDNCKKAGIKLFFGHSKKNISAATIVVRSSAIKKNNVELREAAKRKIPSYDRIEVLANIVALKKKLLLQVLMEKQRQLRLWQKFYQSQNLTPLLLMAE